MIYANEKKRIEKKMNIRNGTILDKIKEYK